MSYFTETFESILEFKSDIALGYARRREHERFTRYHNGQGKREAQQGKDIAMQRRRSSEGSMQELIDDAPGKTTLEKYKNYNKAASRNARKYHERIDDRRNKAKHESFDPVYEDLCNMGVID